MLSLITSAPWKAATAALGVVSLGLGVTVFVQSQRIDSLTVELKTCNADLTTAKNNAATLESALTDQSAAVKRISEESDRRLAESAAALAAAQRRSREAQDRAAVILRTPIKGDNLEQRILDVDAKVLEALK